MMQQIDVLADMVTDCISMLTFDQCCPPGLRKDFCSPYDWLLRIALLVHIAYCSASF
jgi:hypothetical protein